MEKRSEIYDLFWYFAYERQNIFINKINNKVLTNDEILKTYKFCNSYRVNDRVSQYLLKNVIYNKKKYSDSDMIFRIILFKIFNKESTWELLEDNFKDIKLSTFDFKKYCDVLSNNNNPIYNDAYISCATKVFNFEKKHENHLYLIYKMFFIDDFYSSLIKCKTMKEGFELLKSYPLIGNFMAYQLITDINYSEVTNFSESEFTIPGPGCIRGINKVFTYCNNYVDAIKYMYENQEKEFKRLDYNFKYLKNRKLQYIDIQNLFCELDKYCRVYDPSLKSNRKKIKKKYISKNSNIKYIYPKKWNCDII